MQGCGSPSGRIAAPDLVSSEAPKTDSSEIQVRAAESPVA